MKKTFKLLKYIYKSPRFLFDAFMIRWQYIIGLMLMALVTMAGSMVFNTFPLWNRIANDLADVAQYLPAYQVTDRQLEISAEDQPLYYQSDLVQVIIDDQVQMDSQGQLSTQDDYKATKLNEDRLISVIIVDNGQTIQLANVNYDLPQLKTLLSNDHYLSMLLQTPQQYKNVMLVSLFISAILVKTLSYLFSLLILTALIYFLNVRHGELMPMGQRFKMAVMATFLPIIGLELLSLFLPVYLATNLTILLVSGILIYLAFRQHRRYVLTVIKNIHEGRIDIDQVININIDQLEQDMKESDDLESSYEAVQRQLQDLVDSQQETNSKSHDSNEISDQHSAQDHDPTESASQEDTSPSNDKDDSDSGTKL